MENEKSRMRQLISKEEAMALIDEIPHMEGLWISNDKQREEAYKECIRSHECRACMQVMKTFYARKQERTAQGKKITATDERYFKQAEDSLYAELAITLDIPKEKMGDYIARRVEELQKQL